MTTKMTTCFVLGPHLHRPEEVLDIQSDGIIVNGMMHLSQE